MPIGGQLSERKELRCMGEHVGERAVERSGVQVHPRWRKVLAPLWPAAPRPEVGQLHARRRARVKLTDFGLSAPLEAGASAALAGTPQHMAPEQLAGLPASERSEVF